MQRLLGALVIAIVFLVSPALAQQETTLTILHVNDSHGQTQGVNVGGKQFGGYPRLASKVAELRQQLGVDHVLLLHAGDEFSRGDALTSSSLGQANIALWNLIGLDAWTPGNGEFYLGAPTLGQRLKESKAPALTSNVRLALSGKEFARDFVIVERAGVKVGIFGLCFLRPEHPASLGFRREDPTETARRLVPELRKSCDLVIALDHIGLDQDQKLAASVPGIDLIVSGHTHTTLPKGTWVQSPEGGSVLIAQAGDHLRFLGRVDLKLSRSGQAWNLVDAQARLIPLDETVPQDATIKAAIARMWPATQPAAPPATTATSR